MKEKIDYLPLEITHAADNMDPYLQSINRTTIADTSTGCIWVKSIYFKKEFQLYFYQLHERLKGKF